MKIYFKLTLILAMAAAITACGKSTSTVSVATTAGQSAAQPSVADSQWPSKDVTIIVPANAGGGTDMVARLIAASMEDYTGKNFIIVNDTTGGNTVAYETVRNSNPDGLTLLLYHANICSQIATGQYDHDLNSFKIIGNCNDAEKFGMGLYVNGKSEFDSFDELLDYAKENPGKLVCGIESNGQDHYTAIMMMKELGFEVTTVSAGSNTEKIPLLMGENIDLCFLQPTTVNDYVSSGDIKCLAICGSERTSLMPDVPTLREMGYDWDCLNLLSNMFIAGPAGVPDDICSDIYDALKHANEDETVQSGLKQLDMSWELEPTEEVRNQFDAKMATYEEVYKLVNGQ